jgi:hypothetical protein
LLPTPRALPCPPPSPDPNPTPPHHSSARTPVWLGDAEVNDG